MSDLSLSFERARNHNSILGWKNLLSGKVINLWSDINSWFQFTPQNTWDTTPNWAGTANTYDILQGRARDNQARMQGINEAQARYQQATERNPNRGQYRTYTTGIDPVTGRGYTDYFDRETNYHYRVQDDGYFNNRLDNNETRRMMERRRREQIEMEIDRRAERLHQEREHMLRAQAEEVWNRVTPPTYGTEPRYGEPFLRAATNHLNDHITMDIGTGNLGIDARYIYGTGTITTPGLHTFQGTVV